MRSLVLLVAGFTTLSCTRTLMHHELESPSYWWSTTKGPCGHTVAVDVSGVVWSEHSCEMLSDHLTRQNSLDDTELAKLRRAFDALPKDGKPPGKERCAETEHTLRSRVPGRERDRMWVLCLPGAGEWDAKAAPPPYRAALQLMNEARRD